MGSLLLFEIPKAREQNQFTVLKRTEKWHSKMNMAKRKFLKTTPFILQFSI